LRKPMNLPRIPKLLIMMVSFMAGRDNTIEQKDSSLFYMKSHKIVTVKQMKFYLCE
jgi:hypothetical protein